MIDHCYDYAEAAKAQGRPIVGILCEFTPREIILAAGAVPVCLSAAPRRPFRSRTISAGQSVPLDQIHLRYHVKARIHFCNVGFGVAETTCDGKKKMFELMGADEADVCARTAPESR